MASAIEKYTEYAAQRLSQEKHNRRDQEERHNQVLTIRGRKEKDLVLLKTEVTSSRRKHVRPQF